MADRQQIDVITLHELEEFLAEVREDLGAMGLHPKDRMSERIRASYELLADMRERVFVVVHTALHGHGLGDGILAIFSTREKAEECREWLTDTRPHLTFGEDELNVVEWPVDPELAEDGALARGV